MSEDVIIAIIGVLSILVGTYANKVEIKPKLEETKNESNKIHNENVQFLFDTYKEDNDRLREEIKQIRIEMEELEIFFEEKEKELKSKIEDKTDEIDFVNILTEELENDIKKVKEINLKLIEENKSLKEQLLQLKTNNI